jgi:hypothetical protein
LSQSQSLSNGCRRDWSDAKLSQTSNIYVLNYIQLCTALKVKCNPRKLGSSKFEPLLLKHLQQHGLHQPVAHLLRCCLAILVRKLDVMLQEAKKRSLENDAKSEASTFKFRNNPPNHHNSGVSPPPPSSPTHLDLRLGAARADGNGCPLSSPKYDVVAVRRHWQWRSGRDARAGADAACGVPPRLHFVLGKFERSTFADFGAQIIKELL